MLTQVQPPVEVLQTFFGFSAQTPVTGQSVLRVQMVALVRLHEPLDRICERALTQSPSQASPMWSPSESTCGAGFGVRTQLSLLSGTPSPSRSVFPLHARPSRLEPPPGVCSGL